MHVELDDRPHHLLIGEGAKGKHRHDVVATRRFDKALDAVTDGLGRTKDELPFGYCCLDVGTPISRIHPDLGRFSEGGPS